ncbi:MAG: class I SAM-dependent methyltransferase [Chloroflexi bacterium]|nr:class I SAM-dependent methyltransferase [Chloroflexota bacterium]
MGRTRARLLNKFSVDTVRPLPRSWWLRVLQVSPQWIVIAAMPWLASKLFELYVSERLIDYPFAHANLGVAPGARVLDVGCSGSVFPVELASLGYQVWGLDMGDYRITHPNFRFIRGDISRLPFPDEFFDAITAISTIEHIGLVRYGELADEHKDSRAVKELSRTLKPGGRLLITVPFGNGGVARWKGVSLHRAYDWPSLSGILSGLEIVEARFFIRQGDQWVPTDMAKAQTAEPLYIWRGYHPRVVADCHIVARKPKS